MLLSPRGIFPRGVIVIISEVVTFQPLGVRWSKPLNIDWSVIVHRVMPWTASPGDMAGWGAPSWQALEQPTWRLFQAESAVITCRAQCKMEILGLRLEYMKNFKTAILK